MAEAAPQTITTEDYLRRVWPVAGHFALFSNGQHTWVDGPAAAASKAAQASAFGHDVYYSISAFGKQNRAARFAVSNRTFQLDLDTGDHATKYATQEEALRAATDWVAQHNFFVPTFIVNSGWGYHLVWVLTEPVATDRWLAVAQQFKRALQATGLKFDPAVPADAARIMRVPGTSNHKVAGDIRPCFVLHDSGKTVSLEDFARALPVTGPRDALPAPAPGKPKVENEYTKGLDADFPPSRIDPIVGKCQQMAQAVRDEGKTTEPLWRARLSILWRCEGGEALIHAFSQGDPRYDAAQTLAKAFACSAVLKGSGTLVARADGRIAVNPTGNARLASPGTGDVLAGWIGGLWAHAGGDGSDAAEAAAFGHGLAAQQAPGCGPLRAADLIEAMLLP